MGRYYWNGFKEIGWEVVEWMNLALDKGSGGLLYNW
jgi:hypothetical protein